MKKIGPILFCISSLLMLGSIAVEIAIIFFSHPTNGVAVVGHFYMPTPWYHRNEVALGFAIVATILGAGGARCYPRRPLWFRFTGIIALIFWPLLASLYYFVLYYPMMANGYVICSVVLFISLRKSSHANELTRAEHYLLGLGKKMRRFNFPSRIKSEFVIVSSLLLLFLILSRFYSWDDAFSIVILIACISAVILTFTRLRYSWVVFFSAIPALFYGVVFCSFADIQSMPGRAPYLIFALVAAASVLTYARWFYGRAQKNTSVFMGVFLLFLVSLPPACYLSRKGSFRNVCILQMATIEHMVKGLRLPREPFNVEILVDIGYLPALYKCPTGGTYTYANTVPSRAPGSPAFTKCDYEGHDFNPYPEKTEQDGVDQTAAAAKLKSK